MLGDKMKTITSVQDPEKYQPKDSLASAGNGKITYYINNKGKTGNLGLDGVTAHEVGHLMQDFIIDKSGKSSWREDDSQSVARNIVNTAKRNAKKIDGRDHSIKEISAYGGTNNLEAISEAVRQHYTGGGLRLSQEIFKEVEKRLKR